MAKLYPCKHCGNYVSVSAKNCTKCGNDLRYWFEKLSFKAICIILFIFLVPYIWNSYNKQKLAKIEETKNKLVTNPASQKELIEIHKIVDVSVGQYTHAENDIQRSDAYRQMIGEIQNVLIPYEGIFKNWEGRLLSITTIGKGGEKLSLRISTNAGNKSIIFKSYCEMFGECEIERNNPVYDMVRNLKEGDEILFSGKFVSENGKLSEDSFTEIGSILEPEFNVEFWEIIGTSTTIKAE